MSRHVRVPLGRRLSFTAAAPCVRRCVTNACTSPLVGRRDPLGVGLRLAVEPVCFGVQTRDVPAGCLTVEQRRRAATSSRSAQRKRVRLSVCRTCADFGAVRLLAMVFPDRLCTRLSAAL